MLTTLAITDLSRVEKTTLSVIPYTEACCGQQTTPVWSGSVLAWCQASYQIGLLPNWDFVHVPNLPMQQAKPTSNKCLKPPLSGDLHLTAPACV